MKRQIEKPWVKNPHSFRDWGKAQIYKTSGGKLALKLYIGYGGETEPNRVTPVEPRYYSTVLGCYDKIDSNGLGGVVTVNEINGVMQA
jgi:hypothetical protein